LVANTNTKISKKKRDEELQTVVQLNKTKK